jgi:hydrogenase expression/formation protein HypE
VNRGAADQIFINSSGVGTVLPGVDLSASNLRPGDIVLLSGTIGDHGIAILSRREGLAFRTTVESDCAPLNGLAEGLLAAAPHARALRDPTRGGLASALNEFAAQSRVCIRVDEARVPMRAEVLGACEMLGLDPMHVANEGKLVAVVPAEEAEAALAALRARPLGRAAAIVGEVRAEPRGLVLLRTPLDATRVLDMLVGEQLPRIC